MVLPPGAQSAPTPGRIGERCGPVLSIGYNVGFAQYNLDSAQNRGMHVFSIALSHCGKQQFHPHLEYKFPPPVRLMSMPLRVDLSPNYVRVKKPDIDEVQKHKKRPSRCSPISTIGLQSLIKPGDTPFVAL